MHHATEVYEVASLLNEAAGIFTRLAARGAAVTPSERPLLDEVQRICHEMRTGTWQRVNPDSRTSRSQRVAATLSEVVKPSHHPELLDDNLRRVETACAAVLSPRTKNDVLFHPSQWSWVAEFLSTSCHALFRAIATRSLMEQKTAYGV